MTFRERLQKGFSNQERSFSTLLPDSSKISAESGLEIEGAFHASISRCPSVRDMSIRSTSSSSSTSDPRVGSALSVNIGVEPFGRALNCKVLDRSNRSIGGCERKLWPPVDTCRDQLQQAFALKDRRDVVNVPTDPDLFSSFLQGQRSLDKSESSSTIRSKRSRTGSPVEVKCDSDAVGHDSSRHGKRDNVVEEQRSSSCARFGENLQSVKQGEESTRKDLNRRTPRLHLQVDTCNRDVSNSEFDSRMPASPECMPVLSKGLGTPSQFAEESLKRFTERRVELVNKELHSTSAPGFAEVGSAATHRTVKRESEVGGENEQQQQQQLAAEGGSSSPKLFREKLGVVGSRRHEGGVQFGISSHWADHVPSNNQQQQQQVQDHFNFHGEECITNVDEEDEFRFQSGVEFPIPRDRQGDESRPSTVGRPDFHERPVEYSQGTSRDGRRSPVAAAAKFEIQEDSAAAAAATGTGLRANDSSNVRSLGVEGEEIHQQLGGATSIGRAIPEVLGTGRDKGGRADSHFRKPQASASHVSSEERRVRIRLLDSPMPITGRREPAEDASCTKVARPSRPSAGKDRHSKVNTAKGPRDRRVRLSVPTAVQFYDVQDRLGYDQPSKAVEWLIKNAKTAIDELGRLPSSGSHIPSGGSDITHSSSYSGATGLVNPAAIAIGSSCPISGSFSSGLRGAFVEPVGNQMNYFIDPSVQQQVPSFGNSPMHIRDVEGGLGLDQGHPSNAASQGQLGGLSFCFQSEQADLSRGAMGGSIGGKSLEFQGPPLARSESRVKARERARERVKEKCSGRDDGKATGGSCSPSMQSPSLQHQSLIHGSFSVPSPLQSPIQTHAQNLSRPSLQQSSLSSVFNATLSGIMQSPQPGTLQNLIMQNPSLQSSLTDQFQTSLRRPFQTSFLNTIQNPNLSLHHQHSELHIPSLEGGIVHGPLDRDVHEGFASEHGALSFSGRARSSSNHNPSISQPLAITHPTGHSLPGFGMPSSSSMHMEPEISSESASELMHIRAGFSPGPLGTDFRSHPVSTGHSYIADHQRMIHGYSRTPSQLVVPNYNPTSTGGGPRGQDDSPKDAAGGTCLYYPSSTPPNTRIGNLQLPSGVSMPLDRMSFSSEGGNPGGNVSCDYPSGLQLQVMSPGTSSSPPYQSSSSQIQMPARIQGLEDVHVDFDADKLKGSPLPSSPHLHS